MFLSFRLSTNMSGKYFPNNWQTIKESPDEAFETCTFEEFISWRADSWDIPESVSMIIRAEHYTKGGKLWRITEKFYKTLRGAENHIKNLVEQEEGTKFTIVDNHSLAVLEPADINDMLT